MAGTTARGWSLADAPDQSGRVAVVTGANTGIGFEVAHALAGLGATVVLACRDRAKADAAARRIAAETKGEIMTAELDLSSLASIRDAAGTIRERYPRLDLLVNNAAVMHVPHCVTEDGVELTFATNHLGHFALTGLLLEQLCAPPASRVVTVASNAHTRTVTALDGTGDPNAHEPGAAYNRSKLANVLFTYELQRRLADSGAATIALATHPGNVRTHLWRTSSRVERGLLHPRLRLLTSRLAQDPPAGALPILRAALDRDASGGDYYGPDGRWGYTGAPVRVESSGASHDPRNQRELWDRSEQLSGVTYPLHAAPA